MMNTQCKCSCSATTPAAYLRRATNVSLDKQRMKICLTTLYSGYLDSFKTGPGSQGEPIEVQDSDDEQSDIDDGEVAAYIAG